MRSALRSPKPQSCPTCVPQVDAEITRVPGQTRCVDKSLGFDERIRGSHHIFRKSGVEEKINLQRDDGKARSIRCVKFGR